MSTEKIPESPPATATDAEIIDWYLHKVRLTGPPGPLSSLPRDIRGVSLKSSLTEFLTKTAAILPTAEDVKNPFDFWSFMEPVFSTGLRATMIPESGILPLPPSVTEARDLSVHPHYSWTWAMEDCIDLSKMTPEEISDLKNSFPVLQDNENQIHQELERTLIAVDESTKLASVSLAKLHKWLKQFEKTGDFSKLKNASLTALLASAESLIVQLQRDQLLDSIEELHRVDEDIVGIVIDDAERVRCYTTSPDDLFNILTERDDTLEGPQAEAVQYKYPFAARSRLPQIGPFCHICRQAKPNLARCTNKLSQFYGDAKEFKAACHRRFCIDCLVAYNWPKPEANSTSYKCPICAKLCTCDRCVRNVFLKSIKTFISGLKCESSSSLTFEAPPLSEKATYVSSVRDFFNIVGDMSAFAVAPATPSLESPTGEGPPVLPTTGRAKRQSGLRQQYSLDEVEVDTVRKGRAASASLKAKTESGKKGGVKSENVSPESDGMEQMSDDDQQSAWSSTPPQNGDTPPSDRKRRRAASVADNLLRNNRR